MGHIEAHNAHSSIRQPEQALPVAGGWPDGRHNLGLAAGGAATGVWWPTATLNGHSVRLTSHLHLSPRWQVGRVVGKRRQVNFQPRLRRRLGGATAAARHAPARQRRRWRGGTLLLLRPRLPA